MTTTPAPIKAETEAMIAEVLSNYPAKTAKFRAKHLKANDPDGSKECEVKSNIKSRPGVMTIRGCAYAGSKGVVWGPVKDIVNISHGPVGCGQYSWATRRNYARGPWGVNNFAAMQFTTDFQEKDIVFGGDPKLETVCDEIVELFPLAKGISVQSECPIGLIGDDIEAVSRKASKKLELPVVPVRCEGFRGVSQSLGHHIANDAVRDHVLGTAGTPSSRRRMTSRSSATTTSAATPGPPGRSWRRWACGSSPSGPVTARSTRWPRRTCRS